MQSAEASCTSTSLKEVRILERLVESLLLSSQKCPVSNHLMQTDSIEYRRCSPKEGRLTTSSFFGDITQD
jgi:hypothetical protein